MRAYRRVGFPVQLTGAGLHGIYRVWQGQQSRYRSRSMPDREGMVAFEEIVALIYLHLNYAHGHHSDRRPRSVDVIQS